MQRLVGLLLLVCLVPCCFAGDKEHLARTTNPSEMIVSWFTHKTIDSATVQYYSEPSKVLSAMGESVSYISTAHAHHTKLTDLTPNTKYFYRCRSVARWTEWYSFTTPNTSFTGPFMIPIYGDMGVTNSQNTINRLLELVEKSRSGSLPYDMPLILHVGDISYANDRPSDEYETIWNKWFDMVENITRYLPYMVLPGNHEHESGKPHLHYSQYFVDYNYRFKMPLAGTLDPYYNVSHNMWWSMDHGNVHFIALSTETDFTDAPFTPTFGNQVAWLKDDLIKAQANKKNVPWIIAMGHRPLYSSNANMQEMMPHLQAAFEELFHTYGVDIFFCGHVHAYERTWPIYRNQTVQRNYNNANGLVVVTAGAAGNMEGLDKHFMDPAPEWSAFRYDSSLTYGLLNVLSNNKLTWELYESETNSVIDSFTLTKD